MSKQALDEVIKEGMRLRENLDINQKMVQIWARYSMDILIIISRNNFVKYQYSTTVTNALLGNDTPINKLDQCLRFLIDNYSMI